MANPLAEFAQALRQKSFRRIWLSSLLSNLGQHVQAVAAAWTMLQIAPDPSYVALVQTSSMLPVALLALPGGAIADIHDRRIAAIISMSIALAGVTVLTICSVLDLLTPLILLACCFSVGSGVAIFLPAWQASITEQVGPSAMPAAVALSSLSSNVARSVGPALGGLAVAAISATAAFGISIFLYLPILTALLLWDREHVSSSHQGIIVEMITGLRHVARSPALLFILVRTLLTTFGGSVIYAMLPLVARNILGGGADTYGILLGAFGIGAVSTALAVPVVRAHVTPNGAIASCAILIGLAVLVIAASPLMWLTLFALFVSGGCWMISLSILNISVQTVSPSWVTGRALSAYQATAAAGIALGSWGWGKTAANFGVVGALVTAGTLLFISPLISRWAPMPALD